MNKNIEILLNSEKNITSVDTENYNIIELSNKSTLINEYDIRNILSATELFDIEREENEIYRIYGKIEYMSLLNGLKLDYTKFQDFFQPQKTNSKNLLNSFDFYLVKASTGYTKLVGNNIQYVRYFEVIATPNNFELFPIAFSNNVFGEQTYGYVFNSDFDVSNYFDEFNFPATELFLYAKYKPSANGDELPENIKYTYWGNVGIPVKLTLSTNTLNIGDRVYGDIIEYSKTEFSQTQLSPQTYYITTQCENNNIITWKYNPFISFTLRYFTNELYYANISGTSYEQVESIPNYATKLDNNGNYVWRNILPQGYIDPLTNLGVDYPFINKKRYLFSNIILSITPDLSEQNTLDIFKNIWFSENTETLNVTPIGDLNNIGKPC